MATCHVISDLAEPGVEDELQEVVTTIGDETGIARNTVTRNIDKAYPIGQADENEKQKRIVKFTSDGFKMWFTGKIKKSRRSMLPSSDKRSSLFGLVSTSNHH